MPSKHIQKIAASTRSVDVVKPRTTVDPRKDSGASPAREAETAARLVQAVKDDLNAYLGQQEELTVRELAIRVWERSAVQIILHSTGGDLAENSRRIAARSVELAQDFFAALVNEPTEEDGEHSEPAETEPQHEALDEHEDVASEEKGSGG